MEKFLRLDVAMLTHRFSGGVKKTNLEPVFLMFYRDKLSKICLVFVMVTHFSGNSSEKRHHDTLHLHWEQLDLLIKPRRVFLLNETFKVILVFFIQRNSETLPTYSQDMISLFCGNSR